LANTILSKMSDKTLPYKKGVPYFHFEICTAKAAKWKNSSIEQKNWEKKIDYK